MALTHCSRSTCVYSPAAPSQPSRTTTITVPFQISTLQNDAKADYILYYKPNIPIAVIEAKDNNHSVRDGMQQALDYAVTLNIPFVFSSNGVAGGSLARNASEDGSYASAASSSATVGRIRVAPTKST